MGAMERAWSLPEIKWEGVPKDMALDVQEALCKVLIGTWSVGQGWGK